MYRFSRVQTIYIIMGLVLLKPGLYTVVKIGSLVQVLKLVG